MSETIVKFECDGCDDGYPCTVEYSTCCPDMCKVPENCIYFDPDDGGEPDWKRIE